MQIQSSSVAQKNYYLERSHEREKELIIHHFWTICYVTVSIILILSVGILFYKKARKVEEERRRILILKETTDIRLDEADKSIAQIKTDYDIIKKKLSGTIPVSRLLVGEIGGHPLFGSR